MADRIILMDKDPGRIMAKFEINFPHPRNRKVPPFIEMVDRVYAALAGQTMPEHVEMGTAPGEPGRTRALPHININDLANALKPVVLPGETMSLRVIKAGEEPGQGVGYLEDGTMVVVEGGRDRIGQAIELTVTSVLQTSAGRMVFGRPEGMAPPLRRWRQRESRRYQSAVISPPPKSQPKSQPKAAAVAAGASPAVGHRKRLAQAGAECGPLCDFRGGLSKIGRAHV